MCQYAYRYMLSIILMEGVPERPILRTIHTIGGAMTTLQKLRLQHVNNL